VPLLEAESGLRAGDDFGYGYSPERINPGDKVHRFETITKVVSGQDAATLEVVAAVYESVVKAGVFRAASVAVAEAAKVIENTQRDLNIALMNELAVIFNKMGIDTLDVLAAARTKWNFLPFEPGLVGGHCIGVDPYYLTYKATTLGHHPQVILAGRRINDEMAAYVARRLVRLLLNGEANTSKLVTILGFSFKEDVPDLRNTKVASVIQALNEFGVRTQVYDPVVDAAGAEEVYGIRLCSLEDLEPTSVVLLAVPHKEFRVQGWTLVRSVLDGGVGAVLDLKGVLDRSGVPPGILVERM
jgi:UDP-N-acetyl-D-galactosamine dehydrogenase